MIEVLENLRMIVFRLADWPTAFTDQLPSDSPLFTKLWFLSARDSTISTELFKAIPEPESDLGPEGLDVASLIGAAASSAWLLAELIAPDRVPAGGRIKTATRVGFHMGDPDAVQAWLDARGCVRVPIESLLSQLSFVRLRSASGEELEEAQHRSHTVNVRDRRPFAHAGRGIFVVDRSDRENERFTLYHHPGGLRFGGDGVGPNEQSRDVELDELVVGDLTTLELVGPVMSKSAAPDLSEEWIAVGRPSELPEAIARALSPSNPFGSRLFWVAPAGSPLVQALRAAVSEPPLDGISEAFRLCDRLEDATAAGDELEAGFHRADGEVVRAWLRDAGCRMTSLRDWLVSRPKPSSR